MIRRQPVGYRYNVKTTPEDWGLYGTKLEIRSAMGGLHKVAKQAVKSGSKQVFVRSMVEELKRRGACGGLEPKALAFLSTVLVRELFWQTAGWVEEGGAA